MEKRGISLDEVEAVLDAPDITYPSNTPGRHVYVRTLDLRRIAVVVSDDDHELVITAFNQLEQD
jgi:hypothetical protein